MATAGSVQAKIVGLITKANETTGNTDVNLTMAVDALVKGYGKGGGGEQLTLFAPFLTVTDTEELKRATFTMAANEQNGSFDVSIALRVNGEIVDNPYTATEVGTYTVEAIASAENFADGVNAQIVEVAEHPLESEGLEYATYNVINGPTGWSVSYGTCTDAHVRVPSFHDGLPLLAVADSGFSNKKAIETITLPDSIVYIGKQAFEKASNLVSVNIPSNVSKWLDNAFKSCNKLKHVDVPSGVTSIPQNMFYYCFALESLEMPKNIASIGTSAFYRCDALEYVDFSNHEIVPTLANNSAFYRDGGKVEIRVPTALYEEWISATNWAAAISNGWITVVPV